MPPPIRIAGSVMPSTRRRSSPKALNTASTAVANRTPFTAIHLRSSALRLRVNAANTGTFLSGAIVTKKIANEASATALMPLPS